MTFDLRLVKTATDTGTAQRLAREALWLRELGEVRSLEGQLPRLIEEGVDAAGWPYLVISIPPGAGEIRAFTGEHARFLSSLGRARFRSTDFELTGKCQWLQHALQSLAQKEPVLEQAYYDCETALLY